MDNSNLASPLLLVFGGKTKSKMLFLDDRTDRIQAALAKFSDQFDVTVASSVRGCLSQMANQDFDEVRMEHDLGGDDFEDPNASWTGMEVVRYIQKTGWPPNKPKPIFRIHSTNIFAAYLMVKTLQEMGHTAFYEPMEDTEQR